MSHWINSARRLGRLAEVSVPPKERTDQYQFEEAQELLDLQAKGLRDTCVVDATPINRTRDLHNFFTDSPPDQLPRQGRNNDDLPPRAVSAAPHYRTRL
jgi:hypothetical protein